MESGSSVGLLPQERTRMSDLSLSPQESEKDEQPTGSLWLAIKKAAARLSDWFVIQSTAVKALVIGMALLIPATGLYSVALLQKQAAVAEQVRAMAQPEGIAVFDERKPVVFGTGSILSFLQNNSVE